MINLKSVLTKTTAYVAAIIIALAAAFATGRWSRPTSVEEKTHTEAVKTADASASKTSQAQQTQQKSADDATHEQQNRHVKKHVVKKEIQRPDGTVEKDTVTDESDDADDATDTTHHEQEAKQMQAQVQEQSQQHTAERTVQDHSKVTLNLRPQWLVSAYVGGVPSDVFSATPHFMVGASVEKEIIGPFYAGVWAMNVGTFAAPKIAGGVKASALF